MKIKKKLKFEAFIEEREKKKKKKKKLYNPPFMLYISKTLKPY